MGLNLSKNDSSEDSSGSEDEYEHAQTSTRRNNCENSQEDSNDICPDSPIDTVDAVPPITTMPSTVNLDQVITIEDALDLSEKVSLSYLLYDNPEIALKQISKLVDGGNEKILYNWAIYQQLNGLKWMEKLIEGLCIIQNYQVLRELGYCREDLDVRFLPHQTFTSHYVNKIRKTLYFICENFEQNTVQQLLDLVCKDFIKKRLTFKFFSIEYLELFFLHWEAIHYIKQDNLNNLSSVLKLMDQLDLYEKLTQLTPATNETSCCDYNGRREIDRSISKTFDASDDNANKKSKIYYERLFNPKLNLLDLASSDSLISGDNAVYVSVDNKYNINPNNPGVCLIINQENFYREVEENCKHLLPSPETKLESRLGTAHDKKRLEDTFRKFGFKIKSFDDLIHTEMMERIEEVVNSIIDESSLFVCIMSHGEEGIVYGVNSCRVKVTNVKNLICTKNRQHLNGKPKVLILQSCQGVMCQTVSTSDDDNYITMDSPNSPSYGPVPPRADLFTFWATVPGYGAIRNKKTGSWFIQSFCEQLIKFGNSRHFEDICTLVISDVSNKRWNQPKDQVAMVPNKESSFRKLLYLPSLKM